MIPQTTSLTLNRRRHMTQFHPILEATYGMNVT